VASRFAGLKVIQYEDYGQFVEDTDKMLETIKILELDEKTGRATARVLFRFFWMQYSTLDEKETRDLEDVHGFKRAKFYETVEIPTD
jgi:hypothetical protein